MRPRVVRQPWILHDIQEMFVVFFVDLVDDTINNKLAYYNNTIPKKKILFAIPS